MNTCNRQFVTDIEKIPDPGSFSFSYERGGAACEAFVVRWQGQIRIYRNNCPHMGVTLNWQPHQFFDIDNTRLQCSMHGARFRPLDGVCVWGPCLGQSLVAVPALVEAGKIWVCD